MMNNEITIVRATRDNLDAAAPLFDGYRQFYGQSADLPGARHFLSERIEQNQSVIFLALRDDHAVGFTQLYPLFSSVSMKPIWILNDLFAAPNARRMGVGQMLLQAATDFARAAKAKRLTLATAVDNHEAQSLYEKNGWIRDDAFIHYDYEL